MKISNPVFATGVALAALSGSSAFAQLYSEPVASTHNPTTATPTPTSKPAVVAPINSPRVVKYRKNIDDLGAEELAAYEHAVAVQKQKSQNNVFDRTGFLWQAWVHNCTWLDVPNLRQATLTPAQLKNILSKPNVNSCTIRNFVPMPGASPTHTENPGECEHRKNTFLQWHRAELYFQEQALQAADPEGKTGPSTKNVTIPYWNFTKKPSGVRFPKAFENPASPLYDSTRTSRALLSSLPTTSPYLLSYIIHFQDWPTFGGDEYGSAGGGTLETQIHNQMHATYIDGNMGDNSTAGLDPIFYVFHNFLDYSLERWIEEHNENQITGSGRDNYMRGEQDDNLLKPVGFDTGSADKPRSDSGPYTVNMGQAKIYFDTKKQGFAFQPGKDGEFIPKAQIQALIDQHEQAGFVFGDNPQSLFSALLSYGSSNAVANPRARLTGSYLIPDKTTNSPAKLNFTLKRGVAQPDYSFQADVYLYPPGVKENIADINFRNRYLISNTVHWGLSGPHGGHEVPISINVTGIINSLVKTKQGEKWNLTVGLSGTDAINAADFSVPTISGSLK